MSPTRSQGFTLIELLIVIAIIAILALIAIPNFIESQTRAKVSRVYADLRSLATALEAYFVDSNNYPINPFAPELNASGTATMGSYTMFGWYGDRFVTLTTPVAYIARIDYKDPFTDTGELYRTGNGCYFFNNVLGASRACDSAPAPWYNGTYGTHFGTGPTDVPCSELKAPMLMGFDKRKNAFPTMWNLMSPGPDRNARDYKFGGAGTNKSFPWMMLGSKWAYDEHTKGDVPTYDPSNGTISGGNIWRLSGGKP